MSCPRSPRKALPALPILLGYDLALDPGSESVKLLARTAASPGGVIAVPSLVARVSPGRTGFLRSEVAGSPARLIAARSEAARGAGPAGTKDPGVRITRPISRGVVVDVRAAERLFQHVFQAAPGRTWSARPRVLAGAGAGMSDVEENALADVLEGAGARRVRMVPSLVACAVALDAMGARGPGGATGEGSVYLVMELGAGGTGLGFASRSGVLASAHVPLGSRDLDRALAGQLARRGLSVTDAEAERLRRDLGLPAPGAPADESPLGDIEDVLPRHVGAALDPFIAYLADELRRLLARSPEGAVEDLIDTGVVLAGGPAATPGLAARVSHDIELPVRVAPDPAFLTVAGLAILMERRDLLDGLV